MNKLICTLLVLTCLIGCNSDDSANTAFIIPQPTNVELTSGTYLIKNDVKIVLESGDEQTLVIADQLSDFIKAQLAVNIYINEEPPGDDYSSIVLRKESSGNVTEPEAYTLAINNEEISITANENHGLFNGIQSLKQLIFTQQKDNEIPQLVVTDQPTFSYRGMMLDVSRHFFSVEEVKRFIDLMALYKLNKFHWHLTDDQGWRIEIKQYPLLTDIGSYRFESMLEKTMNLISATVYPIVAFIHRNK